MARSGWLTMRNVPKVRIKKHSISDNEHFNALLMFFKKHTTCPTCGGKGYVSKLDEMETIAEAVVRFQGIHELEELSESGEKMTDIIRDVLEYQAWKKRRCSTCKGLRFVKKDKIKELKKRMKQGGCIKKNKGK